jgi:hypothetical protein
MVAGESSRWCGVDANVRGAGAMLFGRKRKPHNILICLEEDFFLKHWRWLAWLKIDLVKAISRRWAEGKRGRRRPVIAAGFVKHLW